MSPTLDTHSHRGPGLQREAGRSIDAWLAPDSEAPPDETPVGVNQLGNPFESAKNGQVSQGKVGEPRRNRTCNPQIKRRVKEPK